MKKLITFLCFSVALHGCASPPKESPPESAAEQAWVRAQYESQDDLGTYPSNYMEIITKYMSKRLKDPDSAKYADFESPKKDLKIVDAKKQIAIRGYSVCGYINSKNSYGGYTGAKRYWFLIRNNLVVDSMSPEDGEGNPKYAAIYAQLVEMTCKFPKVKNK